MSRFGAALAIGWFVYASAFTHLFAAPPTAKEHAMTAARNLLVQNRSSEAIALLEAELQNIDGDREFLDLLRAAYSAEVRVLTAQKADARRIASVETKLALLGRPITPPAILSPAVPTVDSPPVIAPIAPASAVPPSAPATGAAVGTGTTNTPAGNAAESVENGAEFLKQAATLFNQARSTDPRKYTDASRLFGLAFTTKVQMRKDQLAAWAYCRIKLAADRLNKSTDAVTATEVGREIEAALALAPDHAGLQGVGRDVLAAVKERGGQRSPNASTKAATPEAVVSGPGWQSLDSDNFRIRFQGESALAQVILERAEKRRADIAARWSGPLGGAWKPKCELVLHPTGATFATATGMNPAATGRAEVKLQEGVAIARRIDLRADDAQVVDDSLPRELTHVVLADLFYDRPPAKWAEIGMAVLATSESELSRHLRTVPRCARNRELPAATDILRASDVPTNATALTGYYVASVSMVDYLVGLKGDKAFTSFLRDTQRYGTEAALKRQYGFVDSRQFEEAWRKAAIGQ